jgi:vacuolar-type H+-ATPase subunit H
MRFTIGVDRLRPCVRKLDEAEERADRKTEEAEEAASRLSRRLTGVKLVFETVDEAGEIMARREHERRERPDG